MNEKERENARKGADEMIEKMGLKPIDLDQTENKIGNTERSDYEFYKDSLLAQHEKEKLDNANMADSLPEALLTTIENREKYSADSHMDDYMYSKLPSSDYTDLAGANDEVINKDATADEKTAGGQDVREETNLIEEGGEKKDEEADFTGDILSPEQEVEKIEDGEEVPEDIEAPQEDMDKDIENINDEAEVIDVPDNEVAIINDDFKENAEEVSTPDGKTDQVSKPDDVLEDIETTTDETSGVKEDYQENVPDVTGQEDSGAEEEFTENVADMDIEAETDSIEDDFSENSSDMDLSDADSSES